ncbi:SpoIIE family protein phosphatase [Streptomyces sp. NBC_00190]|uniref:SpoIIE family protein phosphatase n=1 Tax=unclassified Streptomyces TaxID=2593676 RepID=UPI002E2926E9|nr:SpoIIE family protein phosphatase [Streptomyces sp. NBC_00190]WSZ44254.1 SpoIIE family protein phosphatase [Streptomyces sp. NBC_00868]
MNEHIPVDELISGAAQAAGGWLGSLPVALVATSADGTIVRWNQVAQELLGYTPPQMLGHNIAELVHPGADRSLGRSLWEAAASGRGVMGTVTAWHRDGHPLELEIWASPVSDRRHEAATVLVFAADAHAARRIRGSSAVWDGLFARSPVGIAILDTQLRFLQVNAALEAMNGLPESVHVGRRLAEILPEVNALEMEEAMRQVMETGEPVLDRRRVGRTPTASDRDRVWSCSYVRVEDPAGMPIGVIASLVDITEQQRDHEEAEAGRRRLALLNEASMRVGSSLDLERTAQALADLAVPRLADTATVDILDALARGDEPGTGLAGGVVLRRLGKAPLAGSRVTEVLARLGGKLVFPAAAPYTQALAGRQPFLIARLDERAVAPAAPHSAKPAELLAMGVHSFLMAPLVARDSVLGVATFYRTRPSEPFGSEDVTLAAELAARAALSMDNARLYHREHETAVILQRSMLPQHISPPPGIEVSHRYLPASDVNEVGGDWYDVLPLTGGRAGLIIGDVMGHGIAAGAVMGRLSASVRALARLDLSPVRLLHQLEAALCDLAEPMLATLLYVVCDPATGHCTVTRAGHPPPVLALPDGTVRLVDTPPGVPLGVGGVPFTPTEFDVPAGGVLVLYTDGLIEARGHDLDERLAELMRLLADRQSQLDHVCDSLITHLVPAAADDDIALMVVRIGH